MDGKGRPFTGAWIETSSKQDRQMIHEVAPSRGRGLKLVTTIGYLNTSRRPFTGAWIETPWAGLEMKALPVAPSRGRGLKLLSL